MKLGISFLPYYTVNKEIKEGSLKMLEVTEQFAKFRTQLAYFSLKQDKVGFWVI